MRIPRRVTTGGLLIGTVLAAIGLNLQVIGLNTGTDQSTAIGTAEVAPTAPEDVAVLTSADSVALAALVQPAASSTQLDPAASGDADVSTTAVTTTTTALSTISSAPTSSALSSTAPQPSVELTTTATSEATTTEPMITATTAATTTEYLTYDFEGVATIVVALHNGRSLEFWSATPEEGWAFMVEDDEPSEVKIKFRPLDGGDEAEFEVEWDDGRLKVKREY